jgi:hypothetical protein
VFDNDGTLWLEQPAYVLLVFTFQRIHHTDASKEYAYDRNSKIGTLDKALDEASEKRWLVVDMKEDWATVFASQRQ